ncbi:MAG: dihydrofolate reductase family protein [Solirubrobacteraceae bacterium]
MSNAGAHLVGAATYARWAGFWPSPAGPFAAPMNQIPKVVFSNSLTSAGWGETTIATGDLADTISRLNYKLKQERSGGYLLAQGGVRFARSLVETGLSTSTAWSSTRSSSERASDCSQRPSPSSP